MVLARPRILVPLDGSPTAAGILLQLAEYFVAMEADVLAIHVVDQAAMALLGYPELSIDREAYVEGRRQEAMRHLEHVVGQLEAQGVRATLRLERGDAATTVLRAAAEEDVTTIALTSHGCSTVARWGHGSVVGRVLRASSVPILLMPAFHKAQHPDRPSLRTTVHPFDRILVAVGPEGVDPLIERVATVAEALFSRVVLLHVMPKVAQRISSVHGEMVLERAKRQLSALGVEAEVALRRGDVASTIVDFEWDADTIALCIRRPTATQPWPLGSIAEKVVETTFSPLLLVPPAPTSETSPASLA